MKVRSPDGDTEYIDIVAGVLQGDTLAPYLFIICLDYVLRTSIDKIRENGFEMTKKRSRRYPAKTITDADYADDIVILANTPNPYETLLHSLEQAAAGIGLHANAHKTEYMCYNRTGDISTLDRTSLKMIDKFTYLGSSISSTEKDIDTRLTKAWIAIDRLSIIGKSDLIDKMKRSFFQTVFVSILQYGCTTWALTKRLEKKLDDSYTRMLWAILNKSWLKHPTRRQLYGHLPPITKTIQARRTRHTGHRWRSKDKFIIDVLLWTPAYGQAKAGRPAGTYIQQLCEDTGCSPEDLLDAMNDKEKWRKRVRDIHASDTTSWWWWYIYIHIYKIYIYIYIYIQIHRLLCSTLIGLPELCNSLTAPMFTLMETSSNEFLLAILKVLLITKYLPTLYIQEQFNMLLLSNKPFWLSSILHFDLVWFGLDLWHINLSRLFNAISIFMYTISSIF